MTDTRPSTHQPSILHVITVPVTGMSLLAPLVQRQREAGCRVEFATGPGEYLEELQQMGCPVQVVPLKRKAFSWSYPSAVYQLWKLMRSREYDIVHTHTPIASYLGRIAARLAGVPITIYHLRGSFWDSGSRLARLGFTALERLIGTLTDQFFTLNARDAEDLVRFRIAAPERVLNLGCGSCGVNLEIFNRSRILEAELEEIREQLGLKVTDFVVGFIGRLVRSKGVLDLLDAFQLAAEELPDLKLLLVGGLLDSERDRSLENLSGLLEERRMAERVIRTGFRKDVPRMLALMDVLVLPSYREGFGMVQAEAGAMSVPVISTRTRGSLEAVQEGVNGLLIERGDPREMADKIFLLRRDPGLREQMGREGRRIAEEQFSEEIIYGKIIAVYQQLLGEQGVNYCGE